MKNYIIYETFHLPKTTDVFDIIINNEHPL